LKVFDKVSHSYLRLKLNHYAISNSTLSWVTDFLNGRTQGVVFDGQTEAITFTKKTIDTALKAHKAPMLTYIKNNAITSVAYKIQITE